MISEFTHISDIDDGAGRSVEFTVNVYVSCKSPSGEPHYDIEYIVNQHTDKIIDITSLPMHEQVMIHVQAQKTADKNADFAYQEYIEGLHEWQGESSSEYD